MNHSPTERLIRCNRQAIAVLRLGIPLDLGLGANAVERLRDINDDLASRVGITETADALFEQIDVPPKYVSVARMLLAVDDPTPVFESIARPELHRRSAAASLRVAATEPLVVAVMAYLGLLLFCLFSVPSIERQYADQNQPPEGMAAVLVWLRETLPIWAVLFPIALFVIVGLFRRGTVDRLWRLLPGSGQYRSWLQSESQATRLSALIAGNTDRATAIKLAAPDAGGGTSTLGNLADRLSTEERFGDAPRALRRIAHFYHFLAEDRRRNLFERTPFLIGLFVAALIVLGYALAVFLPWVDILFHLGESGGGR